MEGLGWISQVLFRVPIAVYSAISGILLSRWLIYGWNRHRYFQKPTSRTPVAPPSFGRMVIYAASFFVSAGIEVGLVNQLIGNPIAELISKTFIVGGLFVILMVVAESIKKRIESKKTKGSD